MADLGNCGHAILTAIPFRGPALSTPLLGEQGWRSVPVTTRCSAAGWHTTTKNPVSVVVNITNGFLGDHIALFKWPAAFVEQTRVVAGGAFWYDLDDGIYTAMSTTSEQAWRVEIAGSMVTITDLFLSPGGGTGVISGDITVGGVDPANAYAVLIRESTGRPIGQTAIAPDGTYSFSNLPAGNYAVVILDADGAKRAKVLHTILP